MKVIANSIEKTESVVTENAASSEESAVVSQELLAMVESMEEQIQAYRLKTAHMDNNVG